MSETLTGIVLGPGSDTLQHSNGANGEPSREDGTVDPHPDMHAVINRIINHGENVDSQYGTHDDRTILKSGIPNGALGLGANSRFQIQSLPVLENLVSWLPVGGEIPADFGRRYNFWRLLPAHRTNNSSFSPPTPILSLVPRMPLSNRFSITQKRCTLSGSRFCRLAN